MESKFVDLKQDKRRKRKKHTVVLAQAIKAYSGSGGMAPLILNL